MENVNDQLAANALKLRVGKTVYWLTYEYLPEISAYMLCYAQADTLTGNLPRIILIVGCILIAFLLLVFLFSKAMYRSILKRLETLVTSMQAVEKNGDLSIRIPEPNAPGDELDTLSRQFNAMLDRTQQLMEQNVQSRLAAKDAQLHALQSQIDSHFLYNALESVRMMAETKHETELSDTLYALGSLLRYNMSWKTQNVTLKDEIDNIRKYIYLINFITFRRSWISIFRLSAKKPRSQSCPCSRWWKTASFTACPRDEATFIFRSKQCVAAGRLPFAFWMMALA